MPPRDPAARLLDALEHSNDVALASVLSRDVRLVVDSGDDRGGELRGRALVARELHDLVLRHPDAAWMAVHVNGAAGLAMRRFDGQVVGVLGIQGEPAIDLLWLSTAPRKLASWNRRRPDPGLD
ncbi:hypothetical protein [Agromyces aureus]|uniref:SnoaL-like domain-containing protein n=1 Tax=Agromyces aureus TaxID=453304 RepID=A0A191WCZ9_9MICO|nr:hypothetical protein [Agromyces aureus]ANJ26078.1 hypothetical protein ATC03_04355 [Agromyces aureus]